MWFQFRFRIERATVSFKWGLETDSMQNTQFDSVAEMEAAIERLFFRSLLQTVICKHFPEEWER